MNAIKEAQTHKHNLEAKINLLLNEFNELTGLHIYGINIHDIEVTTFDDLTPKYQYQAQVEIRL